MQFGKGQIIKATLTQTIITVSIRSRLIAYTERSVSMGNMVTSTYLQRTLYNNLVDFNNNLSNKSIRDKQSDVFKTEYSVKYRYK